MKKRITLEEFEAYCVEKPPKDVSFYTKDQKWFSPFGSMICSLTFPTIVAAPTMHAVAVKSEWGHIYFDHVEFVMIERRKPERGDVAHLVCQHEGSRRTYRLLLNQM